MSEGEPDEGRTRKMDGAPGCLTIIRGGQIGLSYRVTDKATVIGRGESADVVVVADGVSRKHVELARDATGAVELSDLGSRNGTFVNRVRVSKTRLEDGDRIRIGDVEFDFRYEKRDDRATVDLARKGAPAPRGIDPSDSVARRFVSTMANLAQVHFTGGRFRDALATYERAVASLDGGGSAKGSQLTAALVGIGQCHLELGAPHRATAPLQRALDMLQARGASPRDLMRPRFALARALGVADERAVSLAQSARDALDPDDEGDGPLRLQIDAWLHPQEQA